METVIETIGRVFGRAPRIDSIEASPDYLAVDTGRFATTLGFAQFVGFERGISATVRIVPAQGQGSLVAPLEAGSWAPRACVAIKTEPSSPGSTAWGGAFLRT